MGSGYDVFDIYFKGSVGMGGEGHLFSLETSLVNFAC